MLPLFFASSSSPQSAQGGPGLLVSLIPILLIFIIFYFLLIRPQQKKQKQHTEMINSLRKGDRIVTNGGIYGTVADVKDHIIVLRIADDVKVEIIKNAIAAVMDKKEE